MKEAPPLAAVKRLRREIAFHDAWAKAEDLSSIKIRQHFEGLLALENKYILSQMGSLSGKSILDIGPGLGEASIYFALQGAEVMAADISQEMLDLISTIASEQRLIVTTKLITTSGILPAQDSSFDFIYIANTIHHVQDRPALYAEMKRVLKPGGRFFSYDPLKYNPIVNIYRRIATDVRTIDEEPIGRSDIKEIQRHFANVQFRTFWLTLMGIFVKFYFFDRIDPNKKRYWKLIFDDRYYSPRWCKLAIAIDSRLTALPIFKWLAWNCVISGTKSDGEGA